LNLKNSKGISISTPGCDFIGIIAHEIGHALGTFHEQARPDQSRHIAIHYKYSSFVKLKLKIKFI